MMLLIPLDNFALLICKDPNIADHILLVLPTEGSKVNCTISGDRRQPTSFLPTMHK